MPLFTSEFTSETSLSACEKNTPLPALETRMLISAVTGLSRTQLITQSHRLLSREQASLLSEWVKRRLRGEPMAYILGEREFFGLTFRVNPNVLIPRPETELLVEKIMATAPPNASICDIGTGSGAIAISIAKHRQDVQVCAVDISDAALGVAKDNAHRLLGPTNQLNWIQSSWLDAVPPQAFHIIVSNPPYIEKDDTHLQQGDLRFEPSIALTDFADGLSAYRHIIQQAPHYLHPQGWIWFEHGYNQASAIRELLAQAGFQSIQTECDWAGIERITGAQSCLFG